MTFKKAKNEIETLWKLNEDTTIKDINDYYYQLTGLDNLSTASKLNYLYEYIIASMLTDGDITIKTARKLFEYYRIEG